MAEFVIHSFWPHPRPVASERERPSVSRANSLPPLSRSSRSPFGGRTVQQLCSPSFSSSSFSLPSISPFFLSAAHKSGPGGWASERVGQCVMQRGRESVPRLDESDPFLVIGLAGGRKTRVTTAAACQERRDTLCHCEREIAIAISAVVGDSTQAVRHSPSPSFLLLLWPLFPFLFFLPSSI